MSEPRVILIDIETLPNLVWSWGLAQPSGYISHENIERERFIACASWKTLGADRVDSVDFLTSPAPKPKEPDYRVAKKLHDVISSADAIIAHNGDRFDVPWSLTRILINGFDPPPPVITIDTRAIAKRKFYFNSNKLDYLGHRLGLGQKIKTDFDLWKRVAARDGKAMREMVAYNKEDVRLLERVYLKLRPFVPAKLNHAIGDHSDFDTDRTCPSCGKEACNQRGYGRNRVTRFVKLQCQACGAWAQRPCGSKVVR